MKLIVDFIILMVLQQLQNFRKDCKKISSLSQTKKISLIQRALHKP